MIIYKTTNLINSKIYIGQDSKNRPSYLGSGFILQRAIGKYGRVNFKKETIEHCTSLKQLNEREVFWIEELNSTNPKIGYNIATGGQGGNLGPIVAEKKSKSMKIFIKENPDFLKASNNPNYNNDNFHFYNIITNEEFIGTRYELAEKIGSRSSNLYGITDRNRRQYKNWILFKNKDKYTKSKLKELSIKNNSRYNSTVYFFKNKQTGIIENMTQNEFRKKYNIGHSAVSMLCSGKRKSCKGWILN